MKRNLIMTAMAVVSLISVSCNKNLETEPLSQPSESFCIYVPCMETKTINNGLSTQWVSGDRLAVHHAVSGTKEYVNDGRFNITDVDKGTAEPSSGTGPELDADTNYDWYVYYRYNGNQSPDNAKSQQIGSSRSGSQSQNGNDSMSHITGTDSNTKNAFPLYGSVKGVPGTEFPTVVMKNVAALIEYKVTNSLEKDIIVTGVTMEGSKSLVGTVSVNYEEEEPVITDGTTSNTCVLNVAAGTAIASGASACFYAGVIPGEQTSLTVTVNVKDADEATGSQVFTLTPTEPVIFRSGKIKTLALPFSQAF